LGTGQTADSGNFLLQFGDLHPDGFYFYGHRSRTRRLFLTPAAQYEERGQNQADMQHHALQTVAALFTTFRHG